MRKKLAIVFSLIILGLVFGYSLLNFGLNIKEALLICVVMFTFGWGEYELGKEMSE